MKRLPAVMKMAAWGIAAASLIWFLAALFWLKSPIGVHFDSDGNFDVIDSKLYGFYPHIINALCIGLTALADFLTDKVKIGMKVTEKGEHLLRTAMHLSIGWGRLLVVVFFAYWNALVIVQKPLSERVPTTILSLLMIGFYATIIAFVIIRYRIAGKGNADA